MLNMKNKLAKRIMAFVLSGAMVISGMAPSGMTAYAAEASTETAGYVEETEENEAEVVSDKAAEETPDEDSGADAEEENTSEAAKEETSKEAVSKEETSKSDAKEEVAESIVEEKKEKDDAEETTKEENNKAGSFSLDDKNLTAQTIAAGADPVSVGDFFIRSGAKAVTIETGKTSDEIDGKVFTARIKFGGSSAIADSSIHFKTTGKGKLTVYAQMGSTGKTEDRYCGLFSYTDGATGKGKEVGRGTVPCSNAIVKLPYNVPDKGNYYIGSVSSGMHIWGVYFEGEGGSEPASTVEPSSVQEPTSEPTSEPETDPIPDDQKHTVWVVGDSTVSSFDDNYYYPRYGYGTQIQNYLDGYYEVNNLALSGRSSKNFTKEKNYTTLTEGIKPGDVLIVGFGHNDEKADDEQNPGRYTSPVGDWQTEGSFAKSLYDNYVKLAEKKGATAIICTPIVRRTEGEYKGSVLHVTADGDYPAAIKQLEKDKNVKVVDLTTLTKEYWVSAGNSGTLKLHAWTNSKETSVDNTHLNIYGAKRVAYMLAEEIAKFTDLDIASHVKTQGKEPTEENDLKPNPGYEEPTYTPPTTDSKLWEPYGIFKGSAFGSLGKSPTTSLFTIGKDAAGNMHLKASGNGKLSNTENGIVMYYYRIPSDAKFTLSAKATVNEISASISNPSQAGFGLMARDNMFIDINDKTLNGDFVVAGTLADGNSNCFYYKDGKLNKNSSGIAAPKAGDVYDLRLAFNGDGYECTFGNNPTQSGGYDFMLTSMDDQYQYIGMFVSRNADISFSDIKLTVDGKEIDIMDTTTEPDPGPDVPTGDDLTVDGDGGEVEISKTDGFKKGKLYGYKNTAIIEVAQDMPFWTREGNDPAKDSYAFSYGGKDYEGCVQGSTGPSDTESLPIDNKAAFKITAVKNSKITFIVRDNRSKNFHFRDQANDSDASQDIPKDPSSTSYSGSKYTFSMEAGHTYWFWAGGSKVMAGAISIEKTPEGEDPKPSQSASEEKPSDTPSSEEKPSQPSSGEEKPSQPSSGEEKPSQPSSGEEEPSQPDTEEESSEVEVSDTEESKITADDVKKPISLDSDKIKVEAANLVKGKKQQYAVTVTYTYTDKDGNTYNQQLTEGLHYRLAFAKGSDGITVGPQTIVVTGTGEVTDVGTFVGKTTVSYEIIDKKTTEKTDIKKLKLSLNKDDVKNALYTGTYITPRVEGLAGIAEENYNIVYKNNVNVGRATVTVIGQNDYYGSKVFNFSIKKRNLSKTTINADNAKFTQTDRNGGSYLASPNPSDAFAYKGSPVVLENLTLSIGDNTLSSRTDYKVVYKNNAKKGTAVAEITGLNNLSGTVKIRYTVTVDTDIASSLDDFNDIVNPVLEAEFSSKGPRLTSFTTESGATLREGTDYTVNYRGCTATSVGDVGEVKITGKNAYRNVFKNTTVVFTVVPGKYHMKDGVVLDEEKVGADAGKIINAAKITDAAGVKVKESDVIIKRTSRSITVTPDIRYANKYKETRLACRTASNLSKVKQIANIENQYFDGVNTVTLTEKDIAKVLLGVEAKDIRIVSYRNNNKAGTATVMIEARTTGSYYGTKNIKFKITTVKPTTTIPEESEEEESPTTEPTTDIPDEPDDPTIGQDREKIIDVWDFGAKEESDEKTYKNHITADSWNNYENLANDGKFSADGEVVFGDLTLNHLKNDRIYSATANKTAGSPSGVAAYKYSDGYTAAGDYYCNGTGGNNRRNYTIANVLRGDRIDIYVGTNNSTATDFYFEYVGTNRTQKDTGSIGTKNEKISFVAKYAGSYKIWADASGGKPITNRVKRVPAVDVSGTLDLGPLTSTEGIKLKFVNETTKAETSATLDGTSFTAKLAAGYSYNAVITGKVGYGPTNASKNIKLTDDDALSGKSDVKIVIEEKEMYVYSGTIKGFAADYARKANLKVIMKTAEDVLSDDIELTITGLDSATPQFTGRLEPDVEYTITLEGVNDYQVKGDKIVNQNKPYTADIEVELRPVYAAAGNFVDLDGNAVTGVKALTFKNVDDEYEYTATIAADGKSYKADLRDGIYSAVATIENYQTTEHVIVEGKAVNKDILFVSTAAESDLTRKADLYVGYSDKGDANYETVSKAVKAAKRMKPTKEEERITIHIAPGVYREQIIVDVPYISFVNDTPDKEVKLTWYQGIGYQYYSSVTGWYDAQNAHDQYKKGEPKNWGAAVQIKSTGFLAENIVFEHSLNRYITDEELADGVEPTASGGKPARDYALDVKSKNATERGCAMFIDTGGNNAEFYRCKFLSSQDTVGTGKTGAHAYFKECFIEGGTDYICYDGDTVFDNCVLNFKGYSDKGSGGYITAAQDSAENGYLFWNCTVTGSKDLIVDPGYFGRPWGAKAKVTFVNTKLERSDLILAAGWTSMSNAKPENANFAEYNTTSLDGKTVDTSKRVAGTVKTTNPVPDTAAFEKYFGGWTPKHYQREDSTVAFAQNGNPYIQDNGDSNLPRPGHTLTAVYSLGEANDKNDASIIKWYRVKGNNATLITTQTAQQSRSYKIQTADVGYTIRLEVTPTTTSGRSGEAKSVDMTAAVLEGWDEPGESDAVLGNGVNVFLAGDSTVKDYSAQGMYNSGKARIEGSWGEYIQSFFNEEKVTIVNYANGGRSTRNFINEGSLDKIKKNIKKGDYLFIQFGHNDCAANYPDRFVPVGKPDANGIYPKTEGTKTESSTDKNEDGSPKMVYEYNCGGTFKWFLKQYVDVAKEAGATPVLVTPVARMYYTDAGKIRPHHDCGTHQSTPDNTYASSNDAYVVACRQLADEEGVLLLDAFAVTKKMYEDAYTAGGNKTYGEQIMGDGDSTHCNKLGGFIEAGLVVQEIKKLKDSEGKALNITTALKKPAQVLGKTPDPNSQTVFTINASSKLTAFDFKADPSYSTETAYWTKIGQDLIDKAVAN